MTRDAAYSEHRNDQFPYGLKDRIGEVLPKNWTVA